MLAVWLRQEVLYARSGYTATQLLPHHHPHTHTTRATVIHHHHYTQVTGSESKPLQQNKLEDQPVCSAAAGGAGCVTGWLSDHILAVQLYQIMHDNSWWGQGDMPELSLMPLSLLPTFHLDHVKGIVLPVATPPL